MSKSNYKRLGDYIREVNVRNRDLKVTKLMGVNMGKFFMPSVANVIGTDLSNYKIVDKNQFACNLMHVGRDEKIPMAIKTDADKIIVSPAYFVFEVIPPVETVCTPSLRPEYLMMWFRRPEFDRNAWFYTDADVRGGMNKEALLDMRLPIPSIAEQQRIVAEYEALSRRIAINEQICTKLEETATALYRKMFVDNIDKENLPEGWRMGTLGDVAEITMGQSPDGETYNEVGDGMIFYQGRTDFGNRFPSIRMFTTDPKRFAKKGDILLSVRAPVGDINIAPHDCCIGRGIASIKSKINCNGLVFYTLMNLSKAFNVSDGTGTIFGSINKDELHELKVIVPKECSVSEFEKQVKTIDNTYKSIDFQIKSLKELQSLLLAKIVRK
ncbi:MAG: restriction endonuclease subunit S [Paludibacteraceae bacterium]|nr:restriction endonuclease subunit S [Paludibacteraceae bacterium]